MNHASKLSNLMAQRRFNQMELAQERDPQMKLALTEHIKQLDNDIAGLVEQEEVTQVIPRITMQELVYGGEA